MAGRKPYQESLLESLADASEAAAWLNAAREDGDPEVFLLALRNVADVRPGGMSKLAEATGPNRESLYRMLSEQGNPELNGLSRLLHALGLKLAVEADDDAACAVAHPCLRLKARNQWESAGSDAIAAEYCRSSHPALQSNESDPIDFCIKRRLVLSGRRYRPARSISRPLRSCGCKYLFQRKPGHTVNRAPDIVQDSHHHQG